MASYTKFYILRADEVFNPSTWQGGWNDHATAGGNTRPIDGIKDGSDSFAVFRAENTATSPWRVGVLRCITRRLKAQTIAGTLNPLLGILESNADADFYWRVHAYVTAGDTDTVRGTLLTYEEDSGSGTEWPTTAAGKRFASAQSMSSVGCQDNDRIVVEIGYVSYNSHTTSRTGTIRGGAMDEPDSISGELPDLMVDSTNVTGEAGYLEFSQAIELMDPPANDICANATELTTTFSVSLDQSTANREKTEPPISCQSYNLVALGRYNSVWWKWTAPSNQSVTVAAEIVNAIFTFDTALLVLSGPDCDNLTEVECSAETHPSTETIIFNAVSGTTYWFMVGTIFWGGGDLTFTFTPSVTPQASESVFPLFGGGNLSVSGGFTAMRWEYLDSDPFQRHFFSLSGDEFAPTPPGGESYVHVGTAADGVTLQLRIFDGATLQAFDGPVLALGTYYHWAYVKDGTSQKVYLSTEDGSLDEALVIDETVTDNLVPNMSLFLFGSPFNTPKAFKAWEAPLDVTEIRAERGTYAPVRHENIWNVTTFRLQTLPGTGGFTDYSGFDRRAGTNIGEDAPITPRFGPAALVPPLPLFEDFDSYAPGGGETAPIVGVRDASRWWEYLTQPSFKAFVAAGVGLGGTQAFDSVQAAADIWFESVASRFGSISLWSFKRTPNLSLPHGAGATITSHLLGSPSDPDLLPFFGFNNTPGDSDTMRVFISLDGVSLVLNDSVSGVYVNDAYQHMEMFWRLSSVNDEQTGLNHDGCLWIYVNGTLRFGQTGLQITTGDGEWGSDLNRWNRGFVSWGGFIDDVAITMDEVGCESPPIPPCPGIRGAPRIGV